MRRIGLDYRGVALLAACLSLLGAGDHGSTSAFLSNGLGARARGMGGAFVAIADDTTAGYWNPAGLAFARAPLTQVEMKFDHIALEYTPPGGRGQGNIQHTLVIPAAGTLIPLQDKRFPSVEILGYVPYGLQLDWDQHAVYRYNVTADQIQVLSVGRATSYKANDRFAVGVAAFMNNGKVSLANKVPSTVYAGIPGLPDAAFAATGDDTSPNVHLGALWLAGKTLRVGAAYRSPIQLTIQGDAHLAIPGGPIVTDQWNLPLRLPQSASLGAAWQATPVLLVAGQTDWVDWSSIAQQAITFQQGALPNQLLPRHWHNRVQPRIGIEYSGYQPLLLRAGYSYDPTPVPASTLDPLLFDLNRHIVSAGLGTTGRDWSLDVSYEYFFGQPRTTTTSILPFPTNGRYAGHVNVVTLTINYRK